MSKPAKSGAAARKKVKKVVREGILHVLATFNTTHISLTDRQGNVVGWATAGLAGFKGSRKSTPFAAQKAAEELIQNAKSENKLETVEVRIKGPGQGRESAVRAVISKGVDISSITDLTPIPHNGCRPKKKRRV